MDDFLHNLRSGKLKQPDRSNRHFNDPQYKGAPRRNPMDRRKREFDNKESTERLSAIKDVLETLAETQKQMAQAYEARTRAEERKARAMEVLAKNIYRMLNPEAKNADALFALPETDTAPAKTSAPQETVLEPAESVQTESMVEAYQEEGSEPESETDEFGDSDQNGRKLSAEDRKNVFELVGRLRGEGNGWENIARQIAAQGYPTISGKGTWRGVMIKNLYERMGVIEE